MTFTAKKTIKILLQLSIGLLLILVVGVILERNQYPILNSLSDTLKVNLQHRDIASYLPKPYVVLSGSMEPAIKTASVVFSVPQKGYNPGDIITFAQGGNKEILRQAQDVPLITHRIAFKLYPDGTGGNPIYMTAGDANEEFDRWEVKNEDIVGRVVFSIPYVGYAVDFAKRPYGFLLLVIVPATIIIYEELKVLGREFFRFLKKIREDIRIKIFKRTKEKDFTVPPGEIGKTYIDINENTINLSPQGETLRRSSVLIPVLGSALVLISFSTSFFFDTETSIGNVFQAAESFLPEGIADHIVISEVQTRGPEPNPSDKDFIELYNPTDTQYDLIGHRLVRRNENANTDTTIKSWTTSTLIPAHEYYLWANSNGADGYSTLIGADTTTTIPIANNSSIALRLGPENTGTIIDAVSWFSSPNTLKEGTVFSSAPGNGQSLERKAYSTSTQATMEGGVDSLKGNGFDGDNNSTDFILRTVSQPQNSTSATETP